MTPARINRLIARWQHQFGLDNWQVRFSPVPSDEDEHGAITYDVTHGVAFISLEKGIPDEAVEHVVVHEMLHLLLGDMTSTAHTAFDQLGSEAKQLLVRQYDQDQHRAISNLMLLLGFPAREWKVEGWNEAFPLRGPNG